MGRKGRGAFGISLSLCLISLVAWGAPLRAQGQSTYSEAAVKAFLLERIVSFLSWPEPEAASDEMRVLVLGHAALGAQLRRSFVGRSFAGRSLAVYNDVQGKLAQAHVVIIGAKYDETLESLLPRCSREGVLTVGDTRGFAARGVAVNFFREDARVRFEVATSALERAHIKASYKLLTLARLVPEAP